MAESARMHRLTQVSRALTYSAPLDAVLDLSAACAADLLEAERTVVLIKDEEGLLRVGASRGIATNAVGGFREPLDERLLPKLEAMFGPGSTKRFLVVPLVIGGRINGLLAVDRGHETPVEEEEEWLLSAVADQLSLACENARRDEISVRLQRKLEQVHQVSVLTEQALQIAGHDLRTPLNAIQGYLQLLADGIFGPVTERQTQMLERVRGVGKHLQGILEDIVAMTHSAGEIPMRAFSTEKIVRQAVSLVSPSADAKAIEIRVEPNEDVRVRCHPNRLRQVMVHLLDNAVKYSPAGSTVTVTRHVTPDGEGRCCVVSVRDEGPGIPSGSVEEAFIPGRRLSTSPDDPGGSGLGLALARRLMQLMEGSVTVAENEGPGATFEVRLPLRVLDADAPSD